VTTQGIRWASNHPATNEITTGTGPAHSGAYGLFDPDHGFATGTSAECDIDNPPAHCLLYDGWTGTRTSGGAFQGAGGYFTGTSGANIAVLLDGGTPIGIGRLPDPGHHFFGVIQTVAFSTFQFRETDGKVGQNKLIFADDFTFGTGSAPINQLPTARAGADHTVAAGATVTLDGNASDDADGDPLSYSWWLVSRPAASTAALDTVDPVRPTFVADQLGSYTIELLVDDGIAYSDPDTVVITAELDSDGDLVSESQDNCTQVPNADQRDTNGDGYGNLCDGDLNDDISTNTLDLHLYKGKHDSVQGAPNSNYDSHADFNGDGSIDTLDLDIYKGFHRQPPGPSCCGV
jgi:hypothetical protein